MRKTCGSSDGAATPTIIPLGVYYHAVGKLCKDKMRGCGEEFFLPLNSSAAIHCRLCTRHPPTALRLRTGVEWEVLRPAK